MKVEKINNGKLTFKKRFCVCVITANLSHLKLLSNATTVGAYSLKEGIVLKKLLNRALLLRDDRAETKDICKVKFEIILNFILSYNVFPFIN